MKFVILLYILLSTILFGQNIHSDLTLLQRVEALEKRMAHLEKANSQTQQDLSQVEKKADDAKSASKYLMSLPQKEEEKKLFMSNLRIELKSEEAKSSGPWTVRETWIEMRRNLTEFKVRKLLGNPNQIKGSLNPRIERVYHYEGDINADGIKEQGYVNFFKGKSVSFESPFN